ncbi:MAG TPA: ABC transporter substrate-binding protein [Burkholderiales bacterium]|nr:ABC transporter substrate-binding protein [Burkholderiales bacterium]
MTILCRSLSFLLLMTAVATAAAQAPVLRYGQAMSAHRSIFSLPIVVAEREGLFKREGLDFRVVIPQPGGGERMIAALHDDTVDLTHVATPFLVRAALAGSDAVAIAAEFNNPIYTLVGRPDIARIGDLKGRVVGMADPAGSISFSIRKLMALHGVREADIKVQVIEGTPARLACLRRGECAAVPLGQPQDLLAHSEGYRVLGYSTEAMPEFVYTVTAARRSWAAANKDAVVRYVRALAASFAIIRDPARRATVVQTIVETTGVSAAVAERTLELYFQPERKVLPRHAEIDSKGFAQVIAFMAEAGQLKAPLPAPERFVDLQYLQAAGVR